MEIPAEILKAKVAEDILWKKKDEKIIIISLDSDEEDIFEVTGHAMELWEMIAKYPSVEEALVVYGDTFPDRAPELDEIEDFLYELEEYGFLDIPEE